MLLIPTRVISNETPYDCTIDADKVSMYARGPENSTGIYFDSGEVITIEYNYDELMVWLAEHGND